MIQDDELLKYSPIMNWLLEVALHNIIKRPSSYRKQFQSSSDGCSSSTNTQCTCSSTSSSADPAPTCKHPNASKKSHDDIVA